MRASSACGKVASHLSYYPVFARLQLLCPFPQPRRSAKFENGCPQHEQFLIHTPVQNFKINLLNNITTFNHNKVTLDKINLIKNFNKIDLKSKNLELLLNDLTIKNLNTITNKNLNLPQKTFFNKLNQNIMNTYKILNTKF